MRAGSRGKIRPGRRSAASAGRWAPAVSVMPTTCHLVRRRRHIPAPLRAVYGPRVSRKRYEGPPRFLRVTPRRDQTDLDVEVRLKLIPRSRATHEIPPRALSPALIVFAGVGKP